MADRVIFISWGAVARGREARALDVFNESVGFYGRLQQDGRIESFDVTLLDPNGGTNGFIQLHGSAEQIAALKMDEEYRRLQADASMIVDDLSQIEGFTNEGVAREMALFQEAIAKVPQGA
jgi:hypothetical protein